jgi:hypothetical protein
VDVCKVGACVSKVELADWLRSVTGRREEGPRRQVDVVPMAITMAQTRQTEASSRRWYGLGSQGEGARESVDSSQDPWLHERRVTGAGCVVGAGGGGVGVRVGLQRVVSRSA